MAADPPRSAGFSPAPPELAGRMEAAARVAGAVAHELNNALTIIRSYSQLAREALPDDHPAAAELEVVQQAVRKAEELAGQLLAVGHRQAFRRQAVPVSAVVRAMEAEIRRILGEGVRLRLRLVEEGCLAATDVALLEQAIRDLASNAREAMPRGGELTLSTEPADVPPGGGLPPGAYVALAAADTGRGIDPADQARVFEPFYTTKIGERGAGLGLARVYALAQQSRGQVLLRSLPGQGARFELLLPRAAAAPAARGGAPRRSPGGRRLLLVEDEPLLRQLLSRFLQQKGYEVTALEDPLRALALLQAGEIFDLLITDVHLPGIPGTELVRRGWAAQPDLQVLIVSALPLEDPDLAARFLPKPFTPRQLEERIQQLLGA